MVGNSYILIVEDESGIRDLLKLTLTRESLAHQAVETTEAALALIAEQTPLLILLDWMLPDKSGIELIRQLKSYPPTQDIPIIMLTAKAEEANKLLGLEVGADDYITKPFSPRELVARIHAVLRRGTTIQSPSRVKLQELELDKADSTLYYRDHSVKLTQTSAKLLAFLMLHPNKIYSRETLLANIWGHNQFYEARLVDVQVKRLRAHLKSLGKENIIQTVRGMGYQLIK